MSQPKKLELSLGSLTAFCGIAALLAFPAAALFLYHPDGFWPAEPDGTTVVNVCFRPPGTPTYALREDGSCWPVGYDSDPDEWLAKREMVMDALADSWQKWTGIVFEDGGECAPDWECSGACSTCTMPGYILIDLIEDSGQWGGESTYSPRDEGDKTAHIHMRVEHPDERLLRTAAIHEAGHALGYAHEFVRPDAFYADGTPICPDKDNTPPTDGEYLTSYYDDMSVMNYCNPEQQNRLSAGDIEGAQSRYGVSDEGLWLRALPALSLYAL